MRVQVLAAALLVAVTVPSPVGRMVSPAGEPADDGARGVPPLVDPSVEPGIGRCTSDGACTVTDAAGTRPGTPWRLSR